MESTNSSLLMKVWAAGGQEAYAAKMAEHNKPFRLEWVEAGHSSDDKEVTEEQQQMRMDFALETLAAIRAGATADAKARL